MSLPAFLWGLVVPNPWFVALLSGRNAGRRTLRLFEDLRRKYGCDHLWVGFPMGKWAPLAKTLLVLDPRTADAVLESGANFADPVLKKRALGRFIPDALVISSGAEWSDRRDFNTAVLGLGGPHRHADVFKGIVSGVVGQLAAAAPPEVRWSDFQSLATQISHQIILGSGRVEAGMAAQLERLAKRGNWVLLPRRRRDFAAFYDAIAAELGERGAASATATACLMHESAGQVGKRSAAATTQVPSQIGFWFFVLKDAIELHVARTLALIAAHPQVQERVREEVRDARGASARDVEGFAYLEACIAEQLRLWTPVPMLLRRAVKDFALHGATIEQGRQILFHAGAYHRNPRYFPGIADQFAPDPAAASRKVYFFSRGLQSCAGETLARFTLKAVLAELLARYRFELVAPAITPGWIPYRCDHFKIALRPIA